MDWLGHRARTHPDTTALVDADTGEEWSYAALSRAVDGVAAGLATHGIGSSSKVGTRLPRTPAHIQTIWAVRRLGATIVPIDPGEPATRLRELTAAAGLDLLVHEGESGPGESVELDSVPMVPADELRKAGTADATGQTAGGRGGSGRLDETMAVLFTSGTTGEPKGVRLTPRNIGASAAGSAFRLGVEAGDRWLLTLPLYHMGGLSIPFRAAIYGTTVVVEREFDAQATRQTIADHEVTGVSLVPTMLRRLLDAGNLPDTLRFALVGGAPTPEPVVERALAAEVPLYTTYGMTETASQVATATPADLQDDPETVGKPIRTATVRIVDDDGAEKPPGWTGEITVSGPIVSPGYLDDVGSRDAGDPIRTGDVGHLDRSGRLFVTGRASDVIITGGENVHPSEVAEAIRALPSVEDVAVVGVPDREWGERVVALVVLDGEPAWEDLRTALDPHVTDYKIPKTVRYVSEIPRTRSGTVDRDAVRAIFVE